MMTSTIAGPTADAVAIDEIHERWVRANETWDGSGLRDVMAEDCLVVVGNGMVVRGRDDIIREWETLAMAIESDWSLTVTDRCGRINGDVAWITYEFHLTGVFDTEPFNERGRGTEIYERRQNRWKIATGHWSWRQQ
jgi:uncharacterized protein (TIGR02246 family)